MRTKENIYYSINSGFNTVLIPKGTKVILADNLPYKGTYWVQSWQGMDDIAKSWERNYGFLVNENEVEP